MRKLLFLFLLTVDVLANAELDKLKKSLEVAKNNVEMKMAVLELVKGYEKEIKKLENQIEMKLKKDKKKAFIKSKNNWKKYYKSEENFLYTEFGSREKYGTSASLSERLNRENILESRYRYLVQLKSTIY
jgi:transketolase